MPTILALDTATAELTVAVRTDADCVSRRVASGRRTGALLGPTVADVCQEAGVPRAAVDLIAVGVGPGPYTSLRAGLMFARTVGFVLGVPVVGACTLDVIARLEVGGGGASAPHEGVAPSPSADRLPEVIVTIDARRREVYWAGYDLVGQRLIGPLVGPPAALRDRWPGAHVVTAAPDAGVLAQWAAVAESAGSAGVARVPSAWDASQGDGAAAGFVPQALLEPRPIYLRRPDATPPGGGS